MLLRRHRELKEQQIKEPIKETKTEPKSVKEPTKKSVKK